MTNEQALERIQARINQYLEQTDPEKRMHYWFMCMGYLDAMYDAEVITFSQYTQLSFSLTELDGGAKQ